MERSFILSIGESAFGGTVEEIGKKLLALEGKGIHTGSRSMEAVLSHMLKGVRDKILLKTDLDPNEVEKMLKKQLKGNFKHCSIEWMTAG